MFSIFFTFKWKTVEKQTEKINVICQSWSDGDVMESMGCGASNNDNNSNVDNEEINLVSILNFHLLNEKKL